MAWVIAESRGLSALEALHLRDLPDEGLRFEESIEPEWVNEQLAGEGTPSATGPGALDLTVEPLGNVKTRPPIRVRGRLTVALTATCVRCLADVRSLLAADLDLTLFPSELERDDLGLDEGAYGSTLDLPAFVREALLLDLAMNPTCEDEPACSVRTQSLLDEVNEAEALRALGKASFSGAKVKR